jgi:hypothetical protein
LLHNVQTMSVTQVLQFIQVEPSGQAGAGRPSETRRRVRAHARRQAHAAERLARTKKYQAEQQAQRASEQDQTGNLRSWQGGEDLEDWCTIDIADTALPSPALRHTLVANRFGCRMVKLGRFDALLLDFFLVHVVPRMRIDCNPQHDPAYATRLITEVVLPSLSDPGSFSCILLGACRQIHRASPHDQQRRAFFEREGSRYRLISVRALRKALTLSNTPLNSGDHGGEDEQWSWDESVVSRAGKGRITTASVFQAVMLSLDELEVGNVATSEQHARGAVAMVDLGGGPEAVGLQGLNAVFYARLVYSYGLNLTSKPREVVCEV